MQSNNESGWGSDSWGTDSWGTSKEHTNDINPSGKPPRADGKSNNESGWGSDSWGTSKEHTNDINPSGKPPRADGKSNNESGWGSDSWGTSKRCTTDGDSPKKKLRVEGQSNDEDRPAPYKPEELNLEEEALLQGDGAGENFKKYSEQKVTCLPKELVIPIDTFDDILTSQLLLKNVKSQRYTELTPIQKWAMPAIMEGHDLIGCAQTGSGKTAAFLLPVLQTLLSMDLEPNDPNSNCQNPYCLIISPTRELANQIYVHANMLSRDSIIKAHVIYGQVSTAHLKSKLSTGCHILVATPGRLKDFVQRGWIGFKNIKYIILDEGDRLVDEGFTADIRGFFGHESMPPKDKRQTLFFSATFREETQMSAREYLKDDFVFLTVGRIGAANEDIKQEFICVSRQEKKRELKKILSEVPENEKTIVFTQTKSAADMLAAFFTALDLSSTSIHGDRHQSQREQAIRAFRKGDKRFLISSPVGNRGLDLPKVALVINYDLPSNIDEYVHRIGRTGRAGHTGRAISFYDGDRDRELLDDLIAILKEAKQEIPDWMTGSGGPTAIDEPKSSGQDDWGTTSDSGWDAPSSNASKTNDARPSNDDWNTVKPSNDDWGTTTSSNDDWGSTTAEQKTDLNPAPATTEESW